MLIKNMPERVTKRRANAFKRKFGTYPEKYQGNIIDTKYRPGKNKRLSIAQKFM